MILKQQRAEHPQAYSDLGSFKTGRAVGRIELPICHIITIAGLPQNRENNADEDADHGNRLREIRPLAEEP